MSNPRSYLFVPGHRPDMFGKAVSSGAHQVILDLEDAVGPEKKDVARQNVSRWFDQGGVGIVRVNGEGTPWFEDDLHMVANCSKATIMVPKAASESIAKTVEFIPGRPLVALIESVKGLISIHEVASVPSVVRLAFGNLDFGMDARIPGAGSILDPAKFKIVIASSHAGLPAPVDGVTVAFDDGTNLQDDISRARQNGFTAKLCIHPRQVHAVNCGFAPTKDEIDWAQSVVQAIGKSGGAAVQVNGKMVDKPMLEQAQAFLEDKDEHIN